MDGAHVRQSEGGVGSVQLNPQLDYITISMYADDQPSATCTNVSTHTGQTWSTRSGNPNQMWLHCVGYNVTMLLIQSMVTLDEAERVNTSTLVTLPHAGQFSLVTLVSDCLLGVGGGIKGLAPDPVSLFS